MDIKVQINVMRGGRFPYTPPVAEVFNCKPLQLLSELSTEAEFDVFEEGGEI